LVAHDVSDDSAPDAGAEGGVVRPPLPQLVVPGAVVNDRLVNPPPVVVVVELAGVVVVVDPVMLVVLTCVVVVVLTTVVLVVSARVVVVVLGEVVVVVLGEVVVVVPGHAVPGGMQTSVTVSTSVRACTLADRTSARIVHRPGAFPLERVRTSTPVNAPHTELVPFAVTASLRTGPQWPVA
jgi:hypothetical protein